MRQEIADWLSADTSRLGEVYRLLRQGRSPAEIEAELGMPGSNIVWGYHRTIRALLERDLPTATTVVIRVASRYRALLKLDVWSDDARRWLDDDLRVLEARGESTTARMAEDEQAHDLTAQVEQRNRPGVYVYALPHYLRYPYEPESGRTLLKVGHSGSDAIARFRSQTRTTALPEEPVLLRVYTGRGDADTRELERKFHHLLRAADHGTEVTRTAGTEWFVTSTTFLDALAGVLDLGIEVVAEMDRRREDGPPARLP